MQPLDFDSHEKISAELYRQRDELESIPEFDELKFVEMLNKTNQRILKNIFDLMSKTYNVLDVCGFDVVEIRKREKEINNNGN